jgi:AraC family transcriptional regulator
MAYAERVNLGIDHVVGHLGEPLRLADVARAARLSPFHFHRVFQVLVGETLGEFVKRLRLERALVMMAHGGGIALELRALQWLYGTWLPRSVYVPDDQPGFEAWMGRPFAHGTEHFELYAQLPIKRA